MSESLSNTSSLHLRTTRWALVIAVAAFASAAPSLAATYRVTQLADRVLAADGCSFREAVALHNTTSIFAANDCGRGDAGGDLIEFSPGLGGVVYLDARLGEIVLRSPALTIQASSASAVAIDGGGAMSVLVLHRDAPPTLTIRRLTVRNGLGRVAPGGFNPQGGGLRMEVGGSIVGANATIVIEDSIFRDHLALTGSGVSRGAAITSAGSLTLRRTKVFKNQSDLGAVSHQGDARIEDCEIASNIGATYAAGLLLFGSQSGTSRWVLERNLFRDNVIEGEGPAAIRFVDLGDGTISNSTFVGNSSADGSVIVSQSPLWVTNSTFSGNRGIAGGGGVLTAWGVTVSATSNLFTENDVVNLQELENTGGRFFASFNLFDTPAANLPINVLCGASTAGGSNLCGVGDAGLSPLANHGGPTATMALEPWSLAINAGANPRGLATDQRGVGFPRVVGGFADIGSYEAP